MDTTIDIRKERLTKRILNFSPNWITKIENYISMLEKKESGSLQNENSTKRAKRKSAIKKTLNMEMKDSVRPVDEIIREIRDEE